MRIHPGRGQVPAVRGRAGRARHDARHQRADRAQGRAHRAGDDGGLPRFAGDRLGAPLRAVRHLHGAARAAGAARPALRRARARRRRRRRASGARRAGGAPGRGRAARAQDRGGGRLLPAQLHQRGARAARRRHPGRGAAGRGDLALLRGLPRDPRIRAHLDHHRQRLCPAAHGGLSRRARSQPAQGRHRRRRCC